MLNLILRNIYYERRISKNVKVQPGSFRELGLYSMIAQLPLL
jgi:hypothetical protein